ncbi:TetR/AcrR family transcriptional regulator [Paenibacillus chitinolyticus]|uniref:TetR/AcrR family transcriptional regulator n=1 Tax=Paenibacillus chitinolyticus TaxID=79263 RepID=UPI00363F108D
MEQSTQETRDKILTAAISIMKVKGYKGMTTRAVAQAAGVNESTIFRHFVNKQGILDALVDRYSYVPGIHQVFDSLTGELQSDLIRVAEAYQEFMKHNGEMVLIGLRETGQFPELDEKTAAIPIQLKKLLVDYLTRMNEKGVIRRTDFEASAMTFIWMNLGYFISASLYGQKITLVKVEDFLQYGVRTFAQGLLEGH